MTDDEAFSLDDIFDKFAKPEVPIFNKREVLRSTFVPDYLPHREKEMKQLAGIIGPVIAGGIPSNAFLYGKTGLGKTVTARSVIKAFERKIKEIGKVVHSTYINCRIVDTTYRVYAQLCSGINVDVPITGLPTSEVISKFTEELDKLKTHIIVILDEVDFLQKKDSKTLYGLTRINSNLENSSLSLIGITNDVMFKQLIDARVRSTLTEQEIVFFPYKSDQLRAIILKRAETGFQEGVLKDSAVNKASAIAGSEHGDARRAIDLIRVAGEIAERDGDSEISELHVDAAQKIIETDAVSEVLGSLPIQSKAVLLSIYLSEISRGDNKYITTRDIYAGYEEVCDDIRLNKLTQRRIGDLINDLDLLGMINTSVISKGRYGRTRVINLIVEPFEIRRTLSKDPMLEHFME